MENGIAGRKKRGYFDQLTILNLSLDKSSSFLLGKPDPLLAEKQIGRVLLNPNLWQRIVGARPSEIPDTPPSTVVCRKHNTPFGNHHK